MGYFTSSDIFYLSTSGDSEWIRESAKSCTPIAPFVVPMPGSSWGKTGTSSLGFGVKSVEKPYRWTSATI
jgi:hypothetical protein